MEDFDILLPQVAIEEIIEAAHKVTEAWYLIGEQLTEAADLIRNAFRPLYDDPEPTQQENVTPPRKYTIPLRRYPRKVSVHYNYIPNATRNLPYQRRAY